MAQETNNNKNLWWLKPLIIGLTFIIIVSLVLGFGYKFYNSWLKYGQPKAEAEEKVVIVEKTVTAENQKQDIVATTNTETKAKEEIVTETVIVENEEDSMETTVEVSTAIAEGTIPDPYESEGGLPTSSTSWSFDVFPEEIEVVTGGPGMINNVKLPGGENPDRGFVIIMLPSTETIRYEITELCPGSNWHGAYKYGRNPTQVDWQTLGNDRVSAMMDPEIGNGKSGKGCAIVDFVVVQGSNVIFQETYYRK